MKEEAVLSNYSIFEDLVNQPVWSKNELNNSKGTKLAGHNGFHKIFAKNDEEDSIVEYWQEASRFVNKDETSFEFENVREKSDIYFTLNTFNKYNARRKNLDKLNGLWVDIDYEKAGYDFFTAYNEVENILSSEQLYLPNYIIKSGHGMWLVWIFEESVGAGTNKIVKLYTNMLKKLASHFKRIGGDFSATNPERLMRMPGTFNFKGSTHTEIKKEETSLITSDDIEDSFSILSKDKWSFDEFKENLLNYSEFSEKLNKKKEAEAKYRKENPKNNTGVRISNITGKPVRVQENRHFRGTDVSLGLARIEDLEELVSMRENNVEGYRHLLAFHYRNAMELAELEPEEIMEKLADLTKDWDSKEFTPSDFRCVLNQQSLYIPRNSTIIDHLNIQEYEMESLKTIISKKVKMDRKKAYNTRKYIGTKNCGQLVKRIKSAVAWDLNRLGYSKKRISDIIGTTPKTTKAYIDEFELIRYTFEFYRDETGYGTEFDTLVAELSLKFRGELGVNQYFMYEEEEDMLILNNEKDLKDELDELIQLSLANMGEFTHPTVVGIRFSKSKKVDTITEYYNIIRKHKANSYKYSSVFEYIKKLEKIELDSKYKLVETADLYKGFDLNIIEKVNPDWWIPEIDGEVGLTAGQYLIKQDWNPVSILNLIEAKGPVADNISYAVMSKAVDSGLYWTMARLYRTKVRSEIGQGFLGPRNCKLIAYFEKKHNKKLNLPLNSKKRSYILREEQFLKLAK